MGGFDPPVQRESQSRALPVGEWLEAYAAPAAEPTDSITTMRAAARREVSFDRVASGTFRPSSPATGLSAADPAKILRSQYDWLESQLQETDDEDTEVEKPAAAPKLKGWWHDLFNANSEKAQTSDEAGNIWDFLFCAGLRKKRSLHPPGMFADARRSASLPARGSGRLRLSSSGRLVPRSPHPVASAVQMSAAAGPAGVPTVA